MHSEAQKDAGVRHSHVTAIQKYMQAICGASDMHALIVEGPPGWGKTTAVEEAFQLAGINGHHLGAYSTPLHLYNFLYEHPVEVVILDDVSGVFSDQSAMWPS